MANQRIASRIDWNVGECLLIEKTFKSSTEPFQYEYWFDPKEAIERVLDLSKLNIHPVIRCVTPDGLLIIQMNGIPESYRRR